MEGLGEEDDDIPDLDDLLGALDAEEREDLRENWSVARPQALDEEQQEEEAKRQQRGQQQPESEASLVALLVKSGSLDLACGLVLLGERLLTLPTFGSHFGKASLVECLNSAEILRDGSSRPVQTWPEECLSVLQGHDLLPPAAVLQVATATKNSDETLDLSLQSTKAADLAHEARKLEAWRRRAERRLRWLERRCAFDLLGLVEEDCGDAEVVRKAWKAKALALHPDKGGNAREFAFLQEMKDLLLSSTGPGPSAAGGNEEDDGGEGNRATANTSNTRNGESSKRPSTCSEDDKASDADEESGDCCQHQTEREMQNVKGGDQDRNNFDRTAAALEALRAARRSGRSLTERLLHIHGMLKEAENRGDRHDEQQHRLETLLPRLRSKLRRAVERRTSELGDEGPTGGRLQLDDNRFEALVLPEVAPLLGALALLGSPPRAEDLPDAPDAPEGSAWCRCLAISHNMQGVAAEFTSFLEPVLKSDQQRDKDDDADADCENPGGNAPTSTSTSAAAALTLDLDLHLQSSKRSGLEEAEEGGAARPPAVFRDGENCGLQTIGEGRPRSLEQDSQFLATQREAGKSGEFRNLKKRWGW